MPWTPPAPATSEVSRPPLFQTDLCAAAVRARSACSCSTQHTAQCAGALRSSNRTCVLQLRAERAVVTGRGDGRGDGNGNGNAAAGPPCSTAPSIPSGSVAERSGQGGDPCTCGGAAAEGEGRQDVESHVARMEAVFRRQLQILLEADPRIQRDLLSLQQSGQLLLQQTLERAARASAISSSTSMSAAAVMNSSGD